jgi:quinoprotein glucose dehydrogenase
MDAIRKLGIHEQLGLPFRSWVLVTKTVLIAVQMGYYDPPHSAGFNIQIQELHNFDPHLWVHDKANGKMLAEIALPSNATGVPVTYMVGGKQYIAFPVGGGPIAEELIALSL